MSRVGAEPKPPWHVVPRIIREQIEEVLGRRVKRAVRVWGGYGPTPTYRLWLEGGESAFCKGASLESNSHVRNALIREERAYRELARVLAPWAPGFLGTVCGEGWHMLLLEDVGPASVPPWTDGRTRAITRAYAEFHQSTIGRAFPDWLSQMDASSLAPGWDSLAASETVNAVASLAGSESDTALRWLNTAIPTFVNAEDHASQHNGRVSLLHLDTRSDNLRWKHGTLRLFDWPYVAIGPAELDVAAFAQTVTVEGGVLPEEIVAWYAEVLPLDDEVLTASTVAVASFFAHMAWLPDIPDLPRLRGFQRRQLAVTLAWAARRLHLPAPEWIVSIQV